MRGRSSKTEDGHLHCGIDIGAHGLKFVVLAEERRGLAVRYAGWAPMPVGGLQDDVVSSPRDIAILLRGLVRQSGLPIYEASVVVPAESALIRWIDLPPMDETALDAATRFEARKYLPYPIESADVRILPGAKIESSEENEPSRMRALLAGAPSAVVASRAETLALAGLEVGAMEPEPFAILRALQPLGNTRDSLWIGQPVVFVYIGHQNSMLCALGGADLKFVRAMSWGSARLTAALAEAHACSEAEAERLLLSPGASVREDGSLFWQDATEAFPAEAAAATGNLSQDGKASEHTKRASSKALQGEFDRLNREVQRLLNYYRSLFPERSYEGVLDHVVLCGGASSLKGLPDYFAARLGLPVVCGDPFHANNLAFPGLSAPTRTGEGTSEKAAARRNGFAGVLGLALGSVEAEREVRSRDPRRARATDVFVWRRKAA